ncbi:MAG TPA: HDOD domain-containing protein [Polyangiaceae bacterium]|nr:HDOD domain-containing protein [Polyangiaceae bacterium]
MLFVDDEPLVLRTLRRTLSARALDWEPLFAETGEEALAIVDREPVDVIVSDMHMPKMDGAALLGRIQERHPEIVRIVLSGQSDARLVFRSVPVAHQFLTKPFEAAMLVSSIDRALVFRELVASPVIRKALGSDNRLPATPRTYTALTRALSRDDVSLTQIVELIEREPAVAARVAQLGSSSFFRVPASVRGIRGIVSYLGIDVVKTLVLTVELATVFAPGLKGFSPTTFQAHSLRVAHIARRMLERGADAEDAFLAGVLHDVGRLVLVSRCPALFARALAAKKSSGGSLTDAERSVLGVTHAEIGAYLLGIWGFPLDVVDAVLGHHGEPALPAGPMTISRAVYLANLLAHDPDAAIEDEESAPQSELEAADSTRLAQYRELAREIVYTESP